MPAGVVDGTGVLVALAVVVGCTLFVTTGSGSLVLVVRLSSGAGDGAGSGGTGDGGTGDGGTLGRGRTGVWGTATRGDLTSAPNIAAMSSDKVHVSRQLADRTARRTHRRLRPVASTKTGPLRRFRSPSREPAGIGAVSAMLTADDARRRAPAWI